MLEKSTWASIDLKTGPNPQKCIMEGRKEFRSFESSVVWLHVKYVYFAIKQTFLTGLHIRLSIEV